MDVKKEVQRMADASGVNSSEIEAQINALVKSGKTTEQAMGKWANDSLNVESRSLHSGGPRLSPRTRHA